MSSLALKHNAINLGQGFPDFEMNELLIDLVNKAMRDGHNIKDKLILKQKLQ